MESKFNPVSATVSKEFQIVAKAIYYLYLILWHPE